MGFALRLVNEQAWNFQELATKVHAVEEMIANCRDNSFSFLESKKDKAKFGRNVYFSKNSTKEAMSI